MSLEIFFKKNKKTKRGQNEKDIFMKQRIFRIFLLAGIFLISSAGTSRETRPQVEAGSFRMFIGGKEVGTNSFKLIPISSGFELLSKTEVTSFVKIRFFEHAVLDSTFSPVSYNLTVILPFGVQEVNAGCTGDSIRIAYRRGLAESFKHAALPKKQPLFLLDNNMLDHWAVLFKWFAQRDTSAVRVFGLVPQALKLLPADIQAAGTDTVHIGRAAESVTKVQMTFSHLKITAWVKMPEGRLEKLAIPGQSFVMRRTPEPIPFSPAEKDSLIQSIHEKAGLSQKPSFPRREIVFLSDSLTLAGTLTYPESKSRHKLPAVLFLAGSGALDRNENSAAVHINFFPQLADTLTLNGFVTLRYDKRGTGKSGGNFRQADVKDFLRDARAALQFLKRQPAVDASRVAVVGHSEGAILGLMLASSGVDLGGLVLMAGPARNMEAVVLDQIRYLLTLQGKSSAEIEQKLKEEKAFFRQIREGRLTGATPQGNAAWWREHLQFDPLKAVTKITCPLLIMNGEKDYQVSAEKDARVLFQVAGKAGKDVTLKTYPNLDHLFEPVEGKSTPKKYLKPGRKIPPGVKADLVNWLKEKLNQK